MVQFKQYKCEICGYLWEAEVIEDEIDETTSVEYEKEKEEEDDVISCPMCGGSYLKI